MIKEVSRDDLRTLPARRLDELYDLVSQATRKRFPSRDAQIDTTLGLLKQADKGVLASIELSPPERKGPALEIAIDPGTPTAVRAGTLQALLIDLLSRKDGATIEEIAEAQSKWAKDHDKQPWPTNTIRGGVTWLMTKVRGYGLQTRESARGTTLHLTYPKGMRKPFPHY